MSIDINDFREDYFNSDKTLKEDYLIVCTFSDGLGGIVGRNELIIYRDYSFEFKIVWYKYPIPKRLYSIYKSNLIPEDIIETINKLSKIEQLELKEIYSTFEGKYTPEDVSHYSFYFYHNNRTYSLNMSPYLLGKELFKNKEEKIILKLHELLCKWRTEMYERVVRIHE